MRWKFIKNIGKRKHAIIKLSFCLGRKRGFLIIFLKLALLLGRYRGFASAFFKIPTSSVSRMIFAALPERLSELEINEMLQAADEDGNLKNGGENPTRGKREARKNGRMEEFWKPDQREKRKNGKMEELLESVKNIHDYKTTFETYK